MFGTSDNHEDIDAFTREWIAFYRHYNGCPDEGDLICRASVSYWDNKRFKKARELAKKVFELDDRK